jgi:hypothetical protein
MYSMLETYGCVVRIISGCATPLAFTNYGTVPFCVADPDPGSGAFLTPGGLNPGSGMGKNSGSGIWIRDEQLGSYYRKLKKQFFGLKYLINSLMRIRDRGWKKF